MYYLEGQGDLVSRLKTPLIPISNVLTTSPNPPNIVGGGILPNLDEIPRGVHDLSACTRLLKVN